ncbi:helix-turn-helix domain-containing protein [Aquimarina sp. 2201CG1-2-11]|uniref:helix-turn-helix domain-containing protein n=1 Tax=Aquimarina discodermiae TaxID=3231043 RepID=UPI003462F56A
MYSQDHLDSLYQKGGYDELKRAFYAYWKTDSVKAKKIANFHLRKVKENKDTIRIANGYYRLSLISSDKISNIYLDSIISITKNVQNKNFPARAYFFKAQYNLNEKRDIETVIDLLNKARKYAMANENLDLLYRINHYIGTIKSEHLHKKEEALAIFKKCEQYYKVELTYMHKVRYLYTLGMLAETYIGLKKNDSATYYYTLAYNKAVMNEDTVVSKIKAYFTLGEGVNHYHKKQYQASIDSISVALPTMIDFEDKIKTIDSYFYLGRSYYELGYEEKSIPYFIKTDSILETVNSLPEHKYIKTYEYLKKYYKSINDLHNQNKYLNKLTIILDNYLNDQITISKKVKEDYDILLLKEEQKALLTKLNRKERAYFSNLSILILLLLLSGSMIFYQYNKRKNSQAKFEELMRNLESKSKQKNSLNKKPIIKDELIGIPEKHIKYILSELDIFERNHEFTNTGISIQSLADSMQTNVKYLSRVINHYKKKKFTTYLNELRINHAVKELQNNTVLQKYTIKAIANEFGFNSSETFSNAFYKQIKIKPSFYIKELSKINKTTKTEIIH